MIDNKMSVPFLFFDGAIFYVNIQVDIKIIWFVILVYHTGATSSIIHFKSRNNWFNAASVFY